MAGLHKADEKSSPAPAAGKEAAASNERPAVKPAAGAAVPPSPLVILQATHNDIPEICALYKRVWDEFRGKLPEELIKSWEPSALEFTSWMEGVTYLAARRDRRLVGIVACMPNDRAVQIAHLAVDGEHRRQDVGTSLVTAAIDWSRRANANSIWVETLEVFDGAIRLFSRLGLRKCGELHRHFWNQDVHIFERVL
jgi:GNAT superfamily N-acetyltransferase